MLLLSWYNKFFQYLCKILKKSCENKFSHFELELKILVLNKRIKRKKKKMVFEEKKAEKKEQKIETRYFDELFKDLKEKDADYEKDPELLGIFYNNLLEDLSSNETELRKCLYSYHVDYFINRSDLENFFKIFDLLTKDEAKLKEYASDRRISRAYEACLVCVGGKLASAPKADSETLDGIKKCMKRVGNFLEENFETIMETQDAIYLMRSYLRVIGKADPLDQLQKNVPKKKDREFNIKFIEVKLVPEDWKLAKLIKKLSNKIEDMNLLGKFNLKEKRRVGIESIWKDRGLNLEQKNCQSIFFMHVLRLCIKYMHEKRTCYF